MVAVVLDKQETVVPDMLGQDNEMEQPAYTALDKLADAIHTQA